jgi:hypothetical protein
MYGHRPPIQRSIEGIMDDKFQRELEREFAKSPRIDERKLPWRAIILALTGWIACLVAVAILTS